jgi:hypothetical protein
MFLFKRIYIYVIIGPGAYGMLFIERRHMITRRKIHSPKSGHNPEKKKEKCSETFGLKNINWVCVSISSNIIVFGRDRVGGQRKVRTHTHTRNNYTDTVYRPLTRR